MTSVRPLRPERLTFRAYLVLVILSQAAFVALDLFAAPRPFAFLIGDCPYYAAACESMLADGDLDLSNQIVPAGLDPTLTRDYLRDHHDTQFALSADGRVTLKHSPLVSLPFYALFGTWGLLLANVIILTLLMAVLAESSPPREGSRAVLWVLLMTTPLIRYAFNFSPDLLLTLLCAVVRRAESPLLGGFAGGTRGMVQGVRRADPAAGGAVDPDPPLAPDGAGGGAAADDHDADAVADLRPPADERLRPRGHGDRRRFRPARPHFSLQSATGDGAGAIAHRPRHRHVAEGPALVLVATGGGRGLEDADAVGAEGADAGGG